MVRNGWRTDRVFGAGGYAVVAGDGSGRPRRARARGRAPARACSTTPSVRRSSDRIRPRASSPGPAVRDRLPLERRLEGRAQQVHGAGAGAADAPRGRARGSGRGCRPRRPAPRRPPGTGPTSAGSPARACATMAAIASSPGIRPPRGRALVDELGVPVQGVIGEEGLDAAAPAAAALRAAAAQAHMAELAAARAGAAIELALDQEAEADAVPDHQAGGAPGRSSGSRCARANAMALASFSTRTGRFRPLREPARQRRSRAPKTGLQAIDALPGVDIALARDADGLHGRRPRVVVPRRSRSPPASTSTRRLGREVAERHVRAAGSRGCTRRCRRGAARSRL